MLTMRPVLTTLITREAWRRKGAGGLLLDWGCDQAQADGAPALLEAVPEAVTTYKKHGFRHTRDSKIDCTPFGLEHEVVLAVMVKEPSKN